MTTPLSCRHEFYERWHVGPGNSSIQSHGGIGIPACMSYYHRRLPHRTGIQKELPFLGVEALRIIHFQERAAAGVAEDLRQFLSRPQKSAGPRTNRVAPRYKLKAFDRA